MQFSTDLNRLNYLIGALDYLVMQSKKDEFNNVDFKSVGNIIEGLLEIARPT